MAYGDDVFMPGATNTRVAQVYGLTPEKLNAVNSAYKAQYGTNIDEQALMRAASESQGNYLWGPPANGSAAPAGATVSSPTAKIQTDNGAWQNGAFTSSVDPKLNVAATSAVTAPLTNSPLTPTTSDQSPLAYKEALAAPQKPTSLSATQGSMMTTNTPGSAPETAPSGEALWGTNTGTGAAPGTGAQQNPLDVYNDALSKLGIADARTRVSNLRTQLLNTENLLKGVEGSVSGRTQGSLVTEAQRQRLVASEKAPMADLYGAQNAALGNATADYKDLIGEAKTQTDYTIQGQAAQEAIRQFNVQQQTQRAQFEANLALDTKRFNLSKEQQQESIRQFNAQQQLQQKEFEHKQFWTGQENMRQLEDQAFKKEQFEHERFWTGKDYELKLAALNAPKASASGGGGSRSSGGSGGSSGSSSNEPPTLNDIISYYKTADSPYGGYNPSSTNYHRWEAAEVEMRKAGLDPNQFKKELAAAFGSAEDKAQYGVTGY